MASALNAFIQQYASENLAWQRDIHPIKDAAQLRPGYFLGVSQFAGKYTYRPIRYEEMTREERQALLLHPQIGRAHV